MMSFYRYYGIKLPVQPKERATEIPREDLLTKEQIQAILPYCDPLEKALVLVGVASGLSAIDLINLKVRDLSFDPDTGVTTIHIIRIKTGFEFHTFLTPEASAAVQEYINWRNRKGRNEPESLYIKNKVYSNNDYLFIRRFVENPYLETRNDELRKYKNSKSIMAVYSELCNKANKSSEKGDYNLIRSHNMRRFFFNQLKYDHFTMENLEYMLAHASSSTVATYWRHNPKSIKEEYMRHMHVLAIQKEFDPNESIEFKVMKEQNEEYRHAAAVAEVESSELIALRAEVERLKAEKQDMTYAHWDTVAEHMEERKITEHEFEMQQAKIDELYRLISALTAKTLTLMHHSQKQKRKQ
jgi:integrase